MVTLDTIPGIREGIERSISEIESSRSCGINPIGILWILRKHVLMPGGEIPVYSNTPAYSEVQSLYDREKTSLERAASSSVDSILNQLYGILRNP